MVIKVIKDRISLEEAKQIATEFYGRMVKGVVDIEQEIVALGGEYHMDANVVLLEQGSNQQNVWGFNVHLYNDKNSDDWIEYTSLINIRPNQDNRSMIIENDELKAKIRKILEKIIYE